METGRGAEQGHGICRWIPADMEAKETVSLSAVFHLNKGSTYELKVNHNNNILPLCSQSKYLRIMLDRSLTYRQHLKSLYRKLTPCVTLFRRLAVSSSGAGATMLSIATLALVHSTAEYCAPASAAVLTPAPLTLSSTMPCELWLDACIPHHQTTFLFYHGAWASAALTLTCPPSANVWCLKSRHPFASVYLTTYVRCSGQITDERHSGWTTLQDSILSSSTSASPSWNDPSKDSVGLA